MVLDLKAKKQWPCFYSSSDTTGEKAFEEFYMDNEVLSLDKYTDLGIVKQDLSVDKIILSEFKQNLEQLIQRGSWSKEELLELFRMLLPELNYEDKGKYLDAKM